ncbi:MAG: RHS repeat-associated core domain-containing protein [Nitrospira sp.]|nr:RHS repeat-associated core domain-containing protein [Nitrospira sp.]
MTQYTYEPFGVTSATGAASGNAFTYTGREDDGSGLYYYRARYYHPRLQRFVSEDPIGFGGGINFYGYVSANPLSFRDPLGLDQRVCFYADAAFGFGHVGFGPPDSNTFGFYPDDPISGIGQVKLDEQKQQQCKLIKAPPDKDQCMLNCRLKRQGAPGPYVAYTRQCTSFVRECLKECGLPAGNSTGPFPRDFYNNLPGEGIK